MGDKLKIGSFVIDNKSETFIIAELSANHGKDINIAKRTILAAKEAGADAIKIQTFTPDTITLNCDNDLFRVNAGTMWDGRILYDLYEEAYLPWEWQNELKEYSNSIGLIFFSTPFDKSAVDFLEDMNVPAYKIASYEIMDIPLIEYAASKGKPIIISTGVASLCDIEEAINACKRVGNDQIIILKCTSSYPAKIEDANLNTIPNIKETFNVEVGLSDHTIGATVPILSVALGAKVIEKHFILNKEIGGPDSEFSMEPEDFKEMVNSVRNAEKALGKVDYSMTDKKRNNRLLGRSLFVVEDIQAGEEFTSENVRSIRPGYGMEPKHYSEVLEKKATENLAKGTPLEWKFIY